jgi:hypothetical protein
MINVIFYIVLSPFIFIIAKSIWGFFAPTINNTIEDIFPEKTGCFEYKEIRLKDIICENYIYSLTYLISYGYVQCGIIGKDGSTYQSIYLHIDKDVYNLLIVNYKEQMDTYQIRNETFINLIPFILKNCRFYKYKIKLSDREFKFRIGKKLDSVTQFSFNIENEFQEIKNLLENNYKIRWNFAFLKPEYRYEYQKMLRINWDSQNNSIPEKWFYVKYSNEWDRIRDKQIIEK